MELKDCVALVTGANRGIGEAFVRVLLAERGAAKVYAGSRDPAAAAHLEREFPGRCIAIGLDVTDPVGVAAAEAAAAAAAGNETAPAASEAVTSPAPAPAAGTAPVAYPPLESTGAAR